MAYPNFKQSLVWQKTADFCKALQLGLNSCEQSWYKDSLLLTASRAVNQVALGQEQFHKMAQEQYLLDARQSLSECRSMLALGLELQLLGPHLQEELEAKANEAAAVLYGLVKHLRKQSAAN